MYSYFKQIWTDKRLAGRINRSITLKGSDINRVWTPDAYCYNARLTNLMLPDAETHSKVSISPDGVLEYSRGYILNRRVYLVKDAVRAIDIPFQGRQ